MDDQNKNLLIATALSFAVILGWFVLFPPPDPALDPDADLPPTAESSDPTVATTPEAAPADRSEATQTAPTEAADAPRVQIETDRLVGSVSLAGGRIDDLSLKDYRVSVEESADVVHLLNPVGSENPYYALFGWAPGGGLTIDDVPSVATEWEVERGDTLTAGSPITLRWDSPNGVTFRRTIAVDEDYMFTVTQSVENAGDDTMTIAPYGLIA